MLNFSFFSSNVPAAVAAFAAAITAAYASLKYYSDKAAKVTEFRKAWTESLRQAVAEFSGSSHTIAGRIAIRAKVEPEQLANNPQPSKLRRFLAAFERSAPITSPVEKELATELLSHWSVLRLSYNKIVLHLNPAEHKAYSLAETALAFYVEGKAPDESARMEVSQFLKCCIKLAESRAQEIPKRTLFGKRYKEHKDCHKVDPPLSTDLNAAMGKICDACVDPGSALLLAAFATRQLLHGSYKNVFNNISGIEQGIRAVDTSAAIVIKNVWETIKKGEPTYRRTSNLAMASSVALIIIILASLLLTPPQPQATLKLTISCAVNPSTPAAANRSNMNAPAPQILDCALPPGK